MLPLQNNFALCRRATSLSRTVFANEVRRRLIQIRGRNIVYSLLLKKYVKHYRFIPLWERQSRLGLTGFRS